ncbi:hypothetical protein BGZ54_001577 [Gamsiella multidivaricata]|nr:hypothetical protein BGZ54_001577 [Gamsiella multidivaricata]
MDRALYRLPLSLIEPDPDIDDERHNRFAIYTSHLFTWHGYAMLFFGSCYVFFYGFQQYKSAAPVVTGVAIAFACMGLVPFFSLLLMRFGALILIYAFYIVFICMVWPLEKCGLSRRRAISRRNGGYQSEGITNTIDLRQVERQLEEVESGEAGGGGGLGRTDRVKVTPAMAAIPIVIFRKPTVGLTSEAHDGDLRANSGKAAVIAYQTRTKSEQRIFQSSAEMVEVVDDSNKLTKDILLKQLGPSTEYVQDHSNNSGVNGDRPVIINIPLSVNDSPSNRIKRTSASISAMVKPTKVSPQSRTPEVSSKTTSLPEIAGAPSAFHDVSQTSSTISSIRCNIGQEMSEPEAHQRPPTPMPSPRAAQRLPHVAHQNSSVGKSISTSSGSDSQVSVLSLPDRLPLTSEEDPSNQGSGSLIHTSRSDVHIVLGSGLSASASFPEDYPTIGDEECAICLFDFEDGDELRHLYCDHFFHRGCVDRWLSKSAFCPKCKRGI